MDFNNIFGGNFGNIAEGMCKLTPTGKIAVKCHDGFKSYDIKKKRLVNISNFGFTADNFFFVIPTTKVKVGDIIFHNDKPKCVIEVNDSTIKVINYDNSSVEEIVPQRHMFMGSAYFYRKIVSLFGNSFKSGKGMSKMLSTMMMMSMFQGSSTSSSSKQPFDMQTMMMMSLMGGGENPFESMFGDEELDFCGFDDNDEEEEIEEEEKKETTKTKKGKK